MNNSIEMVFMVNANHKICKEFQEELSIRSWTEYLKKNSKGVFWDIYVNSKKRFRAFGPNVSDKNREIVLIDKAANYPWTDWDHEKLGPNHQWDEWKIVQGDRLGSIVEKYTLSIKHIDVKWVKVFGDMMLVRKITGIKLIENPATNKYRSYGSLSLFAFFIDTNEDRSSQILDNLKRLYSPNVCEHVEKNGLYWYFYKKFFQSGDPDSYI